MAPPGNRTHPAGVSTGQFALSVPEGKNPVTTPPLSVRNTTLLGLTVLGLLHGGCTQGAQYPLRLHDLMQWQLLDSATTVIVGKTLSSEWTSARQPLRWSRQYGVSSARLAKVNLSVEQVIRGSVENSEVTAYYWAPEVYTHGRALHTPSLGARSVHYLITDQGVLRYVADVMRSSTPVFSGHHRQRPWAAGAPDESRIAAILLTPGDGMDVAKFTSNLGTTTFDSLWLAGFNDTLPLLNALTESPTWDVKWAACVQLYLGGFEGQDGCIDRLAAEAVANGREAEVRKIEGGRRAASARFRQRFLSDPIQTAEELGILPGSRRIADYLEMVARHPDQEIALRARQALQICCRSGPV